MISIGDMIKKSQPSLFWCMRNLPNSQREALFTLFAFCRHIDDVARSDMPLNEKKRLLNAWREELNNIYDKHVPMSNIGRKIYKNCMRFNLPKESWEQILNSAFLNGIKPLHAPSREVFEQYVQGMAEVPFSLALTIVGEEHWAANEELAKNLGKAVVVTYILRDIKDDAKQGHLYIPAEILQTAGVEIESPRDMVENKNMSSAREELALEAQNGYLKANRILSKMNKRTSRFLRLIKNMSECQFEMMQSRGWEIMSPKPKIGFFRRMKILYKTLLQ